MIVTEIHMYPVKSTHRIRQVEAQVEHWGLVNDRRWMVVDETGHFLTQREEPRLAQVQTWCSTTWLMLMVPGMNPLQVMVPADDAESLSVVVWKDTISAKLADPETNTWFTELLSRPCQLVYMDNPYARSADETYAQPGSVVSFADGFPLLITSEASLVDLNARMHKPVSMNRFRPNIVVTGGSAFEEDRWKRIRVGDICFEVVKPCTRCVITTIDQETALPGTEPLRALSMFRKQGSKVYFGENLVPESKGTIRVGDKVEVLAWDHMEN